MKLKDRVKEIQDVQKAKAEMEKLDREARFVKSIEKDILEAAQKGSTWVNVDLGSLSAAEGVEVLRKEGFHSYVVLGQNKVAVYLGEPAVSIERKPKVSVGDEFFLEVDDLLNRQMKAIFASI